ncbi:hypothetical protein ACIBCH_18265 [Amycolatopsis thailandensis]|uniref:hypothetical protein n=1 Tax=Amycolatopsis thailandensis TaxID=589330 RepID=UPI0037952762
MNAAQPKEFDKQEFIRAVKKAIADKAPKNLDEADKFGESGKAGEVKNEVQGKVGEGKDASAQEIAETTAAPPEPAADAKQVVPMAADKVPGKPGAPNPAQAAPDRLHPSATDMSAGPEQVKAQMAGAQVTEQQLSFKNSREPQFDKAIKEKKTLEAHSEAAPKKLRADESGELKQVKNTAAAQGSTAMAGMLNTRVTTGRQVGTGKKGTKKTDEDKRKEVTGLLQKVFDQTKTDVEKILEDLDKTVDDQFTTKEKKARDRFTREHEEGMERYKDERYSGWTGKARWVRDLFAGLPEEANRIYERARDTYLAAMDQIITEIADTVEAELKRAKDRIAAGRKELKAAVDKLPADLKAIGREAATEFEGKFDELKDTVDEKGTELVDTLATKYTEAVKAVDAEIAAEKEKNKGLVAKAADAIGGAIKAIIELGRMLMGVLRKAVSAIGAILKDPIGFLGNLVTGVGGGLKLFMKNAGRHLQGGVLAWLLGTGGAIGLQLPATFDILGILTLIAMLLGLSWPNIRARLARRVPNQALVAAETAIPLVSQVKGRGVAGMWGDLKTRVGDLKKNLITNLVSYLLPTIIIAGITWIVSLFNPASAFIRACKMIIDIIRFVVTNARQIIAFVNAVLDAVLAIARGGTGGVPALVERALARAIPVLIGALAALLGIGGIAGKVKQIFQKIARPVNKAIDWVITKIVGLIKKLWAKIKPKKPRRPRRPADRRVPSRPRKPGRPGKPRKQRPDRKGKPRKDKAKADKAKKEDRLKKAVAAIEPLVRRLLTRGVTPLRFRAQLALWRLRYRLSALIADPGGHITARINPSMRVPGTHRKITAAELSRLLTPIFTEAEREYERLVRQTPQFTAAEQAWAAGQPGALTGLSRFEQSRIIGQTPPSKKVQAPVQDVSTFSSVLPPSWQPGMAGKVNWLGRLEKYSPKMAADIYSRAAKVGISPAIVRFVLSTGSPQDIANLQNRMTSGTLAEQRKFLSALRRLEFLIHTTEPARRPGIAISTAMSATMLGTGHAELTDVLWGRLAPMAPGGAQAKGKPTARDLPPGTSTRYPTEQALAERLRHRRVGAIIMALLDTATKPNIIVAASGHDLHPLANAIRDWLTTRLTRHPTPDQLAAASARLRAELVAFLASYSGRSR